MFMPLSSWWDINSPNSRTQPCVYTKNDGQWFIDQIAIRIQNESLLYTSVWWTDMENTLRAMSEDKRVAEWATFLFNEMKWDPTPLLKSLYENRTYQHDNGPYSKDKDIHPCPHHHLWSMVFKAMGSSTGKTLESYVYKLMASSDFNPRDLLKSHHFINILVSWHQACNGGPIYTYLEDSHLNPNRVGYLLKNHFSSAWSYLDTCNFMEIKECERSALLQHYVRNVNTRNFELPQMDI